MNNFDKNTSIEASGSTFDVIVVGGGHAGIEAAYASSKMGSKTLLITLDINKIGLMPCNPAIGGVGKGHIVYEISALGGLMPKICTKTYLQARMLNTKKGPAVQGLRLQIDKFAYNDLCVKTLKNTKNLTIFEGMVTGLLSECELSNAHEKKDPRTCVTGIKSEPKQKYSGLETRVTGVETECGQKFYAKSVILTTGTFLNGLVHIGQKSHSAGRFGEKSVPKLTDSLKQLGLRVGRLKTGTPPRLLKSSLDWSKMEVQEAEKLNYLFEFDELEVVNSHNCYITHTTEKTHEIIRDNIKLSAMYSGNIKGIGPRYCPSIEDKINRFPTKTSHHIFVEPEGANSDEIYPNGISTSLPENVQEMYIKSIPGFENAIITRYGYAIEYDFIFPEQLTHSLETKVVSGLFLAGQINGTTGYEEAGAQGLIAGINAALNSRNKLNNINTSNLNEPETCQKDSNLKNQKYLNKAFILDRFILDRDESYIGVMIDDLVTMGVDEPYRMFTSRAERRLLLRQDNVFLRLLPKAYTLGLVDQEFYDKFEKEKLELEKVLGILRQNHKHAELIDIFDKFSGQDFQHESTQTCDTNNFEYKTHKEIIKMLTGLQVSERNALTIYAEIRYGPYLEREIIEIKKREKFKELEIPDNFEYKNMPGLSIELQQKLTRHKPKTIAQAALIPGITPAAISLLIFKTREQI